MEKAIELLNKLIEGAENRLPDIDEQIAENRDYTEQLESDRSATVGEIASCREAIATLQKPLTADVPPSYGTDVSLQGDSALAGAPSYGDLQVGNRHFVLKDVHERVTAELEHSKAAHANCRELVAQLQARANGDAAKLGEKDHRIIAQEQRIRELEAMLASNVTTPALTADTPLDDPGVQWVLQAVQTGRDTGAANVDPDKFFNPPATTLGGLLAGFGFDCYRLARLLEKPPISAMASDSKEAAWIFHLLDEGYTNGYNKGDVPPQKPTVTSKLWHFGHRAGKAARKAEKRERKNA